MENNAKTKKENVQTYTDSEPNLEGMCYVTIMLNKKITKLIIV